MANLNKCFIIGRLTHKPEDRVTPGGTHISTLRVAVNRDTKDQNGNRQQETTFLDITCTGKMAENAARYLDKGREVHIEGRLRMQQWQDKQTGKQRTKLDIFAENIQFIGGGTPSQPQPQKSAPRQQQTPPPPPPDCCDDDDIPF